MTRIFPGATQGELVNGVGCLPCYQATGHPVRLEAKAVGLYMELRCPRCGRRQPLDRALSAWLQGSRRFAGDLQTEKRLVRG